MWRLDVRRYRLQDGRFELRQRYSREQAYDKRPKLSPEKVAALVACQAIADGEANKACYRAALPEN